MTVAMRMSGAVIARSRATRIRKITISTIGTMTRLSRAAATLKSRCSAVGPPMSVCGPPASLAAPRRVGICSNAAFEYGSASRVRSKRAPPAPRSTGPSCATPGCFSSALRTAPTRAASPTMTFVGALAPAGNASESSFWPATESTESRKPLPLVRSVLSWVRPRHRTSRPAVVAIQTTRGRTEMRSPIRRQKPWVSSVPASPTCGMNGQNARRPVIDSSAGSSVSMLSIASAMPTAHTGPMPGRPVDVGEHEDQQRDDHRGPGREHRGPGAPHRECAASCLSSWRRNSSR